MQNKTLNIGAAAQSSGVSAKMIRHYENIGLLVKIKRSQSGYRIYSNHEVHELRFIKRARDLGFKTTQIAELLKLWRNNRRSSSKVKQLALEHIHELEKKINELQAMKTTMEHLVKHCHGDKRPECPILESLAATES